MALPSEILGNKDRGFNKVSTIESVLSGVVSGVIGIPKGFFSLGATLIDLGAGTRYAAEVEQFFDDLTEFDEKAEATAAGKITEALVNIGIPAVKGMKIGAQLADDAMRASRNNKYFKTTNPNLLKGVDKATKLNAKGKTNKFIAGALGGGVAEAVFVGDVEKIGTFGDFVGGPTKIDRSSDDDPTRELLNRVKFGVEGALFTGIIGGTGKVVKRLTDRNKQLDVANSKLDAFIDKVASGFRARSGKTQEFFDIERTSVGERAADASGARNISRELDQAIDKIFPPVRTVLNQGDAAKRKQMLTKINNLLLSGDPKLDDLGVATFGKLDEAKKGALIKELKGMRVDDQVITDILASLSSIRTRWSDLFSKLGRSLGQNEIQEFKTLFGNKFKNYIGSTYDIFQNQSIFPWVRYKPVKESIDEAKEVFKSSAKEAGEEMTDLQAEQAVTRVLKTARLPKGIRMDKPSDAIFEVPSFFVNRTTLDEVVTARGSALVSAGAIKEADRKVFEKLLGKQQNPMQTILGGTAKLSMITRRNLFFQDLVKKNEELVAAGQKPMFTKTADEARLVFGDDYQQIRIDQAKTLSVAAKGGSVNPLNELYSTKGMAEALEGTSLAFDKAGMLGQLYQSLILYPKGLSQIAKTILSPVTHVRNFVSAGAFATANGIIPNKEAITTAYQALQTPLKGTRQQNDLYEELLKLGVVNSNVRLGDLTRLLEDVNFGETMTSDRGLRLLLKPLSKLKSVSQDLYTAEDDFWKIASWAMEKTRLEKAFANKGITRGMTVNRNGIDIAVDEQFFKQEAADIVKNNIPNYDYVSDFVKSLRKLPIGNFVSFPAEIVRTGTNIVRRGLREINEEFVTPDNKKIKPFEAIGYTRLFGFGTTVAAVPYATQKAFQAIYDVTDEERESIRRYVAQWSKNSTLLPIKNKDGSFQYVDFSHANAYDTLLRPVQTIINAVADGRTDEDGLMNDFIAGTFSSMREFASPFISESIWTEAVADIIARGGRTRDGFQVFNPQDTAGDKSYKIMGHLVKAQMPFSLEQLKRLDRSIESVDVLTKGKFDKYGQTFEVGDELAGLFGFRAVNVNPGRSINFKIADYQRGVRQSRSLFTREALRGGPIEARDIVDSYINANRALFDVRKNFKKDIDAARVLNISNADFASATGRLSQIDINTVDNNIFRPINISPDIRIAFRQNAEAIGEINNFVEAERVIAQIANEMKAVSLEEPNFPFFENPLLPSAQETPVTPNSLNLPGIDSNLISNTVNTNNLSNLSTAQKLAILFGNN